MLEYWMANNDSASNSSEFVIEEVLEDPGSAILFAGYPPWLLYFAAGCCVLFMLIGIPGNLITVAALFRTKKLRNATAVFIMNLSVSDLMFCCFNLPLATSTFWHGSWMHGPLLCRLFPLLRYGLVAVSLFTVLAITINRYVMIGHPRLYPKLYKPKYLVLMVLATWISGFGALIATWFEQWGRFGLDPAIGSCSILPDVNGRSPKEFLFILAFLTPCIAIIVCYARIFYIVRKTALKSRRRDKVTTDLVKASLEVKYTKNFEDSAIGSSCGATLTTTENGGSPTKYHEKNHYNLSSSPKIVNNHTDQKIIPRYENNSRSVESRKLSSVESSKSDENVKEQIDDFLEDETSLNKTENSRESSESEQNESSSRKIENENVGNLPTVGNTCTDTFQNKIIPDLQIQGEKMEFGENSGTSSEDEIDENDPRSNFERSVEFLPFIDTYAEQMRDSDCEIDSAFSNSENVVSQSIPNLRFFEADSTSEKSDNDRQIMEESAKNRQDCCLQVPRRFPRCLEKSNDRPDSHQVAQIKDLEITKETKVPQILNTQCFENDENGVEIKNKFLHDANKRNNSEGLLSPAQLVRYNSEISDEFVSSRSDSPSERRDSTKKMSIFRRESRFRSVRNRAFESGKMTAKDKKLLKMILVIFSSFLICYLPITITKTFKDLIDWRGLNIAGYILIYLTTCINPVIYVVMSSEYRCAYKNVLLCRSDSTASNCKQTVGNAGTNCQEKRRRNRERKNDAVN